MVIEDVFVVIGLVFPVDDRLNMSDDCDDDDAQKKEKNTDELNTFRVMDNMNRLDRSCRIDFTATRRGREESVNICVDQGYETDSNCDQKSRDPF